MDKRLKDLAEQARQSNPNLIWEDAELERFAELVRQDYLRELQALKPVAWYAQDNLEINNEIEVIWNREKPPYAEVWIPLYELNEVTK